MRSLWPAVLAVALASAGWEAPAAATQQVVELQMKEFAFVPATVTLRAGAPAELRLANQGAVEHEFMVYDAKGLHLGGMDPDKMHRELEARSYFRGVLVQVEGRAKEVKRRGKDLVGVTLAAGQRVVLRFVASRTGTFEVGCHVPGHYEAGMRGRWVVR